MAGSCRNLVADNLVREVECPAPAHGNALEGRVHFLTRLQRLALAGVVVAHAVHAKAVLPELKVVEGIIRTEPRRQLRDAEIVKTISHITRFGHDAVHVQCLTKTTAEERLLDQVHSGHAGRSRQPGHRRGMVTAVGLAGIDDESLLSILPAHGEESNACFALTTEVKEVGAVQGLEEDALVLIPPESRIPVGFVQVLENEVQLQAKFGEVLKVATCFAGSKVSSVLRAQTST